MPEPCINSTLGVCLLMRPRLGWIVGLVLVEHIGIAFA